MSRAGRLVLTCLALLHHLVFTNANEPVFNGENPDTCIGGDYQKPTPSAFTENVPQCTAWRSRGCCWANTTRGIHDNRATGAELLWNRCGTVSEKCLKYLLAEDCFYECEPMLKHWEIAHSPGDLVNVPICGRYCDDWFDACKDDKTCIKDWLTGFYSGSDPPDCPADGTQCVTFAEMYGNGEGLCNKIWDIEYLYTPANNNCMVMQFTGDNPNAYGDPYADRFTLKDSAGNHLSVLYVFVLLLFFIV